MVLCQVEEGRVTSLSYKNVSLLTVKGGKNYLIMLSLSLGGWMD